jgi:hypothetical protein
LKNDNSELEALNMNLLIERNHIRVVKTMYRERKN